MFQPSGAPLLICEPGRNSSVKTLSLQASLGSGQVARMATTNGTGMSPKKRLIARLPFRHIRRRISGTHEVALSGVLTVEALAMPTGIAPGRRLRI